MPFLRNSGRAERMKEQSKKKLRTGYTTGACAAAASKAAIMMLIHNTNIRNVEIPFPNGSRAIFNVHEFGVKANSAWASVIKDAGDDPDITNGAEIVAEVSIIENSQIKETKNPRIFITNGKGVGIVTKPGLAVPVGNPAINPIPQKMIIEAVKEALYSVKTSKTSIQVEISVPYGEELAKKTLNPRLGIIGGISILGTTGIVKPISDEAWTSTIKISMDVAKAMGYNEVVLSSGRSSERVHQERYGLSEECYIMMGDYVEFSLLEARKHEFKHIHLCVQWAKMTKIAMGIPQTHVRYGAVEPNDVVNFLVGLNEQFQNLVSQKGNYKFNTAREVFTLIKEELPETEQIDLFSKICEIAKLYAQSITKGIPVQVYLASYEGDIIAESI